MQSVTTCNLALAIFSFIHSLKDQATVTSSAQPQTDGRKFEMSKCYSSGRLQLLLCTSSIKLLCLSDNELHDLYEGGAAGPDLQMLLLNIPPYFSVQNMLFICR